MFLVSLLSWWYSSGWLWLFKQISWRLDAIKETFSVSILLRTLFAPWKQIKEQKTLRTFITATIDNFVSRFVGATVRTVMLVTALLSTVFVLGAGVASIILWAVLPLLLIILPIMSITGVELW